MVYHFVEWVWPIMVVTLVCVLGTRVLLDVVQTWLDKRRP